MAVLSSPLPIRSALLVVATLSALAVASVALPVAGWAKDFRIQTRIFVGDEDDAQPVSETTTLFLDGVTYDFINDPAQVAVFRKPTGGNPGRFILLNPKLRIRTELTTDQITGAMDKLRTWAGRQDDPFLQFAADPRFKESFEADSGKLVMASHLESYTVATSPAQHPQALDEYREFLDWYARLNTLLLAGPPPEPRLRLNAALARHRVLPTTVELTRAGDAQPLRAAHEFTWRLSRADADRIDDVRASLASYREVSNDIFLRSMQSETGTE
jgi:hypothetical protein